jgi:hypothetical protein
LPVRVAELTYPERGGIESFHQSAIADRKKNFPDLVMIGFAITDWYTR